MATLNYGSKKKLEYEGSAFDAPKFTAEQLQKADDARKWTIIKNISCHVMIKIKPDFL
jgi:hypothetical protein